MDKENPFCAQYWSTKVEFWRSGAGPNHGTKIMLSYPGFFLT